MDFNHQLNSAGQFWRKLRLQADSWLNPLDWQSSPSSSTLDDRGQNRDGWRTSGPATGASGASIAQQQVERQARSAVDGQGGVVGIDLADREHPVTQVDLFDTPAGDGHLAELQGLERLTTLYLDGTKVTDRGLGYLAHLVNLETLFLDRAGIGDEGLVHLQSLAALRTLALGGTQITDAGLAHIAHLDKLQELYLFSTKITDEGLKHLTGLVNLRWLDIGDTLVTTAGREALQAQLPHVVLFY